MNTENHTINIGKIKSEAEERINKEIDRLFLHKIKDIKDVGSKEANELFNEINKTEYSLRKQEVQIYPELEGTDFLNKILIPDEKEHWNDKEVKEFITRQIELEIAERSKLKNKFLHWFSIFPILFFIGSIIFWWMEDTSATILSLVVAVILSIAVLKKEL